MEIPSNWSIHRSTHVPHSATLLCPCTLTMVKMCWKEFFCPTPRQAVPMQKRVEPASLARRAASKTSSCSVAELNGLWWPIHRPTYDEQNTHQKKHTHLINTPCQTLKKPGDVFFFYDVSFPRSKKKFFFEITSLFPPRIHFHHRRWLHSCFEALALGTVAASADYPARPCEKATIQEASNRNRWRLSVPIFSEAKNSRMIDDQIPSDQKKRVPRIGIFDYLEPRSSFHHIHLSWLTTRCLS